MYPSLWSLAQRRGALLEVSGFVAAAHVGRPWPLGRGLSLTGVVYFESVSFPLFDVQHDRA